MTQHPLAPFFRPTSVALIGASNRPDSIGQVLAQNLLEGGFAGPVMAVNPHERAIRSALAYADVADLPAAPDLAVIAIPAAGVAKAVVDLGAKGCHAAVVISAGFEPGDAFGAELHDALLETARSAGVRLVGPNCLGLLNPHIGLNASFAHLAPAAGELALVSQSGAIAAAALDWAALRGVGFSKVITVGDALDIDVADALDYLAVDGETRAILLYIESVGDARKFLSAARFAAQTKPVILIKGGRGAAGARAAYSHTGALATSSVVLEAAVRRAGVLQVDTLGELFDAVLLLKGGLRLAGDRLGVLTNGGGGGVLAVDALERTGGRLAEFSAATIEAIDRTASPIWSHRNPADIAGDARPKVYQAALAALIADPQVDAILTLNCPTALVSSAAAAGAVATAPKSSKPMITCWLGGLKAEEGRAILARAAIPTYETPEAAVGAFMHLVRHRQVQGVLMQTPRAPAPQSAIVGRRMVERALADRRTTLSAVEALALLKAYGVPTIDVRIAADPDEAATAAAAMGGPVVLKIFSSDITHKTDVGGVTTGVTADRVKFEARAMLERVRAARPEARIEGILVEPMVSRSFGEELILGLTQDPVFGPVILFGQGGVSAEVVADRAVGLPPLDDVLARDLIGRTRVAKILQPNRGRPGADLDALAATLVALSQIALDLPEVKELDINPLVAGPGGVIALDARAALQPTTAAVRPAIAPYPADLVRTVDCGGLDVGIRPIRADDAPRLRGLVEKCSQEDLFFRFGAGMRTLPPEIAAQLAHIDYDRQMALAAEASDGSLYGVARLSKDVGGKTGEFTLLVRSDVHGHAMGRTLLQALLGYAQSRHMQSVWGVTEVENSAMIDLARKLGFHTSYEADGEIRMEKGLAVEAVAEPSRN